MLYGCPECLDIGCGAITIDLEVSEKTVTWKSFGYQNDYEEVRYKPYETIGPFIFDKKGYLEVFEGYEDGDSDEESENDES